MRNGRLRTAQGHPHPLHYHKITLTKDPIPHDPHPFFELLKHPSSSAGQEGHKGPTNCELATTRRETGEERRSNGQEAEKAASRT
eukprot:750981-Hanusia_phi.AAC.1